MLYVPRPGETLVCADLVRNRVLSFLLNKPLQEYIHQSSKYQLLTIYLKLADGPGVVRFFYLKYPPGNPLVSTKKFSPFGLAVWPAIGDIYIYECLVLFIEDTSI